MTSKLDATPSEVDQDNRVRTLGWDTAYVAPFSIVNQAIVKQKSSPETFDYNDATGLHLTGNWKPWQLCVGGSGADVQMICEVESGKVTGAGQKGDLTGTQLIIQLNLKKVAAIDPINDPTSKSGSGTTMALKVNTQGVGEDPAVSIIQSTFPSALPLLLKDLLPVVFLHYFTANIGEFNHVFAIMDINAVADHEGFEWLKPTAFQYAVQSPQVATLENSAFGLIAMVQGNPISPSQAQQVDVRALQGLSEGSNSSFVISQKMVAKNMLLQGAISTIQGSKASDFELSEDGTSITNVREITWGHFQTKNNGVIKPKIAKNGFTLKTEGTFVSVSIFNAKYENSPGVTVHMTLNQRFAFRTVQAKNGNYVFLPDLSKFGKASITSNVSLSEALQIEKIVVGVVATLGAVLCGVGIMADVVAADAAVATDEAANTANVGLDEAALDGAANENPEAMDAANNESADSADEAAQNPENPNQVQRGGILNSVKFKLAMGFIGAYGLNKAGIGLAKAITALDYEKIPAFDHFAENCLSTSVWPATEQYQLKAANFRESLVLNVALDTAK